MNTEIVNKVIRDRRSVFQQDYTGEKIDNNIIKQVIENATWAPTHKLTQPWRFIVFTGEGIRSLARAQADVYKNATVANGSFKEERYQNLLTKPLLSSHVIVVCMKRDERKSIPEIEEIGAVFCAVQNIYLTATAYGIGGYLSTGGITYFEEAKELFGLTSEDQLIGFFHLGIPKRCTPAPPRKSIDEVMTWIDH
jgi:nitroreductase